MMYVFIVVRLRRGEETNVYGSAQRAIAIDKGRSNRR